VNAVADALAPFGVTITRLPLSPANIVELLKGGDSEATGGERSVEPTHQKGQQ
jgi:carbon-monoxide dehydrogenase large subunit